MASFRRALLLALGACLAFALGSSLGLFLAANARSDRPSAANAPLRSCAKRRAVASSQGRESLALPASLVKPTNSLESMLDNAAAYTASVFPMYPRLVFVAEANYGFKDMVSNFLYFASRLNPPIVPSIVFFALDPFVHEHLQSLNATSFLDPKAVGGNFSSKPQSFRSKEYNKIVGHKFHLVLDTLKKGYDVFLIDVDVVILKHPLHFIMDMAYCDMTVTLENFDSLKLMDINPQRFGGWPDFKLFINTGVLLWRSTQKSIALIEEFLKPRWRRPNSGDDQNEFNKFMLAFFDDSKLTASEIDARSYRDTRKSSCFIYGNMTMQILPASLFPGSYHAEFRMPQRAMMEPILVHFNTLNGFEAKRNYMYGETRNSECWYKWGCNDFWFNVQDKGT